MRLRQVVAHRLFVPLVIAGIVVIAFATIPPLRDVVPRVWGKIHSDEYTPSKSKKNDEGPAEIVGDDQGNPIGLRLSDEAIKGLNPEPMAATEPREQRALPPQFGTINYDNDRLFNIRSRFPGELAEFALRQDLDAGTASPTRSRPLRFGDKVKQGELLAVVWSQPLGMAKSALVDAICSLNLSEKQFKLKDVAFKDAAISLAAMMLADRQVLSDTLSKLSAERSLRMWKLTSEDIAEIEKEAKELRDLMAAGKKRDPQAEAAKWARVEIRAPIFKWDSSDPTRPDPNVELTVIEKNTGINDMLDPIASVPLFKLADLSRLQVVVQPHEEYYPVLRDQLNKGRLNWKIQIAAYPRERPLEDVRVTQVSASLDPNLRTCMVMGYLNSPDLKYLVGGFCTATILVDAEANTVEIPTNALNDSEGESLVFVQDPKDKQVFSLRRVSVAQRLKEFTYVRTVLTERDRQISEEEVKKERRRIEVLRAGDIVVTHGVVELKAAFDNLSAKARYEARQLRGN